MTRHLIRLMWNRKWQNLLLMVEIGAAFLVVVAVAVAAVHFGNNAMRPLGFSGADIWSVDVGRGERRSSTPEQHAADVHSWRQLMREVAAVPGVEGVSASFTGPYRWYTWAEAVSLEGRPPRQVTINRTTDSFRDVLDVPVVAGRWFSEEDRAATWEPIVLNMTLAKDIFGDEDPIGRFLPLAEPGAARKRVIGLVEDFRQFGELSTPGAVMFYRLDLDAANVETSHLPELLLIKLAPGTTAAFEEVLLERFRGVAPTWSFGVHPVDALRESMLRDNIVPLLAVAVIALAMLVMVALGLTGVVWQGVTQRMREFGLRRAQGATGTQIGRQVVAELVVLTSFAVAAGCVLLLQIPLLPLPRDIAVVPRAVFVSGVLVATAAVYLVTMLCAWYPSRLATRVPPAEALHYE